MKKFTNKFVAAIASLAMAGTLCVAGAVTVAGVAWGAKPDPNHPVHNETHATENPKAPWEKDAPTKGTITILKCVKKTKDDNSTTSQTQTDPQCKTGFKPLKDATFKLTKVISVKEEKTDKGGKKTKEDVTLDLSKFESWQKIAKLVTKLNDHTIKDSGDDAEVKLDATNTITPQTTNDKGIAKFGDGKNNLDLGLYKVEETNAPKGYGVSDLQSFYMTLPLPEYTTSEGKDAKTTVSYNYNPVVKPKNKDLSATIQKVYDKTKFASVKDKVPFTITAEVNKAKPKNGKLTAANLQGYKVFDDAPTAAFKTIDASVVKHVKIGETSLDKKDNQNKDMYTVSVVNSSSDAGGADLAAGHKRILVTFNNDGLGKIATALNNVTEGQEAPKVTVDLEFELSDAYKNTKAPTGTDSVAEKDKSQDEVVNKSGFFQAHEKNEGDLPPIIPDTKNSQATIDFGFLQVHKFYKEGNEEKPLENAEFRIFADKAKADACAQGLKENKELGSIDACKAASTINDAAAAGASQPVGAATTDVQTATTDTKGNFAKAYKTRAGVPVYLVEVKAPKGYAISPVVHAVTVEKDKTTAEPFEDLPLKGGDNGKSFWFNLPATGAYGVLIFAVVGIVLIVASVIMYVRNRKEEEQQQNA
ncbi:MULTISPECIES: SpaH/EbpB family LPXTG-anchored major pilin [Gardnerella]|uniref:SpaH/EbpB family LPXTG-anchored major pilin n=1 Tax=Gardnerella TaxID=2701 RepID=UPI001574BE8A|nr:SpaH/EbpB family LPXTG-anchored major pilin [Gardnerella vaginalis]NSX45256.1 SpaH/EbpB family LPXTG-anchored major pilin [Gardnerella vaginalis]